MLGVVCILCFIEFLLLFGTMGQNLVLFYFIFMILLFHVILMFYHKCEVKLKLFIILLIVGSLYFNGVYVLLFFCAQVACFV